MANTTIKLATKISVKHTLLKIPVGKMVFIKTELIKASSIRSAIRVLNKEGYLFESTERNLVNEVKVTRKK